jgi:hypothetical protein
MLMVANVQDRSLAVLSSIDSPTYSKAAEEEMQYFMLVELQLM